MEPKTLLFSLLGLIWVLSLFIIIALIVRAKLNELKRLREMKYYKQKEDEDKT
jgi:hypothetical protein